MTISLPAKWIKQFDLEAGDEVEVEEKGTTLVVLPAGQHSISKAAINVQGMGTLLPRVLGVLHKKGYDELELHTEGPNQLEVIQKTVNNVLSGYEVDNAGKNFCHIRNIANLDPEFEPLLRRVFLLLKTAGQESHEEINKGDFEALKSQIATEEMNNRFTSICRRIINKQGGSTFMYCLIEQLEKIADEYRDLLKYIVEKKKFPKEELKLYKETNDAVALMYDCYYTYDNKKAIQLNEERKRLTAEINKKFEKENGKILHHLQNIIDFSGNCLSFILGLRL
jgi:hypothetical protein